MILTQLSHGGRCPSCEEMYDKYGAMIYRICFSSMRSEPDAADMVQEVFVKYMQKKPYFENEEHQKAWFIRVAINACTDELRKKSFRRAVGLEEIEETAAQTSTDGDMLSVVMSLPQNFKMPILMHYFEDMSVSEIALALKISEANVKMRLSRGRAMLKSYLEK